MAKSKTPSYILTLQLHTEKYQEDELFKRFEKCRRIYNASIKELYKRYNHMRESKAYQKNCKYKGKDRNKIFQDLNLKYGLTEYSLHDFVKHMSNYYNIDSMTVQKIATRAYNAFEGLIFHTADKIKYKSYGELNSIESKTNKQGIKYRDGYIIWSKLKIPVIIKSNDKYAQKAIQDRVKYCRIVKKQIKNKTKYYVQLILEGIPPKKITTQGEIKGQIGQGKVGIDIGTQTIAYSSKYEVGLKELCPEINNIDREIKLLQRKMDRSRRMNNPNKYNDNGTINIHNKDKWIYSNHYIKIKNKRKELYRKQSEIRKQSHNILANYLLNLGNEFYVEQMNYKGLQSRSKKTTINEKTKKYNKKKRFGKSLANKSPSMFLTILDNKLKWNNTKLNKINTAKVKASQYNHIEDKYIKKKLNERWNYFIINDSDNNNNKEIKIQRDLYSAFLIMNVKNNLKEIDRELCFNTFDKFKTLHDNEILRIQHSNNRKISSMGV